MHSWRHASSTSVKISFFVALGPFALTERLTIRIKAAQVILHCDSDFIAVFSLVLSMIRHYVIAW